MRTVTAAVVRQGTQVLLARRAPGQKLAGLWEFPGGKVEEDETLQACLTRELKEELGVHVEVGSVITESIYEYAHGVIRLVALETTIREGTITLSVHDAIAWVDVTQFGQYALAPADVPIAETLREMISASFEGKP